jgi:uncharacterized protein YxeA
MNKRTATFLFVALIIVVVIFMIFTARYMVKNKEAFVENPFIYGANKMGNVECSCMQNKDIPIYFAFNDTDFWNIQLNVRR